MRVCRLTFCRLSFCRLSFLGEQLVDLVHQVQCLEDRSPCVIPNDRSSLLAGGVLDTLSESRHSGPVNEQRIHPRRFFVTKVGSNLFYYCA
jgi:hypothetical protein